MIFLKKDFYIQLLSLETVKKHNKINSDLEIMICSIQNTGAEQNS